MSLYIKFFTTFWSHRKTMRLVDILGNDGFWIAPKLWCYAATHQPDGDFSGYTDGELNLLLGYPKDSPSIRQAMLQAGFMDEGYMLHDWEKHNSCHVMFAERARTAAKARWQKRQTKPATEVYTDNDTETDTETSIASSITSFTAFWEVYPRKVGKKAALVAFRKHCRDLKVELLVAAIERQKLSEQRSKDGGKFIPNPATWLNQGRWEDELPPAAPIDRGPNI